MEKILLQLLAEHIPSCPSFFDDETAYCEPTFWMKLQHGRYLEITYEDTGDDDRFYSWKVRCSETHVVIDEDCSDDMSLETRMEKLKWAITVAEEKPVNEETIKIYKALTEVGGVRRLFGDLLEVFAEICS